MTASNASHDAGGDCLVIGYDRTESSRRAISWAVQELVPDGKLVIVHACRPLHAPDSPLSSEQERAQLGRAIVDELLLEGERPMFDLEVAAEVSDSDPVSALIDASARHGARAIVVGCDQHSRLHTALGTVTSELLKTSTVPVIAVPKRVAEVAEQAVTQPGAAG
jgi:nucleotide-binding universal stress UspA family protein